MDLSSLFHTFCGRLYKFFQSVVDGMLFAEALELSHDWKPSRLTLDVRGKEG